MITFEQAVKRVLDSTKRLSGEKVLIEDSADRVLMEDIYAQIEMPPFNKSAMDGYALKTLDIKNVPVKLKSIGLIQAGQMFEKEVKRGECVKIMTGAALPKGADTVVMVEDTRQSGKDVEILRSAMKGMHVCKRGEDIKKRQKLLEKGTLIGISDVGLLATAGKGDIKVFRQPRVAVLNTGGEIVPAGTKRNKRQIYNSNGPQLLALLKADNIKPRFLGIAKDNHNELVREIRKGLVNDVLMISGGVSMGDYDLIPDTLRNLGVKEVFHGVKIKPGKPLFFGTRKGTVVFGIPGNPVSNFLAYHIYIRPALFKMMGRDQCAPCFAEGIISKTFHHKVGRKHFVLGKISQKGGGYSFMPVGSHGSADILSLAKSDGFMVVEEKARVIKTGARVKFITWE
ncbi:MAG: gephyrin-like molybdotransferase Glp [Candidatus Omnitrophota bacterium]